MRLLMIRHGDPDYEKDSLTEQGVREARALAAYADRLRIDRAFVSPLGRAQRTAAFTLERLGMEAEVKDWLQEFPARVDLNRASGEVRAAYGNVQKTEDGRFRGRIVWDIRPSYLSRHPEYLDREAWRNSEIARCSDLVPVYDEVIRQWDAFLAEQGYVRDGFGYRAERPNRETIALFCHYGITSVLLSRLANISPFVPWHSACTLPTSITEVATEERQQGIASFRMLQLGALPHLVGTEIEPSFSARFCETWDDWSERH